MKASVRRRIASAFFLVGGLLPLCQADDYVPTKPIGEQIKVTNNAFNPAINYSGPDLRGAFRDGDELYVKILVSKDRTTGAPRWGIILQAMYDGSWRHYTSVSLVGGKAIDSETVGTNQVLSCSGGCRLAESSVTWLGPEEIRAGLSSGLKLRFNAKSGYGSFETELPAAYFTALAEASSH